MRLFKSILLIVACHTAQASMAIDISADPNLTGAVPLTGILNEQQSDMQNMNGFDNTPPSAPPVVMGRMLGAQLFNGTNADSGATVGFNPNYILNPGNSVQAHLWGAFTFDGALQVDPEGGIFLPNVGPVKITGVSNSQLNALVTSKVKEVYQSNVNVYASLLQAQPVKVYMTGFARNPGLCDSVTSDLLLNYPIRAGGTDPECGSYVSIVVKCDNRVRFNVNLYDLLLNDKLGLSQLADGDTIIVGSRQHTFSIRSDVFNNYDFEFRESSVPITEALGWACPKPDTTHITAMRRQGLQKRSECYPISSAPGHMLQNGDILIVSADRYADTVQMRVEGVRSGEYAMVLPYGSTMCVVLERVRSSSMSQMNAVQLYRLSVTQRQKEMLNLSLQKLEEVSLSAQSSTKEEASLRIQEAQLINRFVAKTYTVVPKGEVILSGSNIDSVLLEDGDVINIPEKTSLAMIHGEVLFPNVVNWQKGITTKDYIEECDSLTQKSGSAEIIVTRQNNAAVNAEDVDSLKPDDRIMVLPKYESKNIEVAHGISTILYQLAVGTKVVLSLQGVEMSEAVIVIPARYDSSRLPGKPLLDIVDKPVIQHIYERVLQVAGIAETWVTTSDRRVEEAVQTFDEKVIMTRSDHESDTDWLVEIMHKVEADIYISLQGDGPMIHPQDVGALSQGVYDDPALPVATLCHAISAEEATEPSTVKVVVNIHQDAFYFSRSSIPYPHDAEEAHYLKHVDIYAYRRDVLRNYSQLSGPMQEQAESLEQLQLVSTGINICTFEVTATDPGVDTSACLEEVHTPMARELAENA